jgi:hypothetical protein
MVKWMSEQQFRLSVIASAVALVAVITYMRFCGSVSLPGKPPRPEGPSGTQGQLLSNASATPAVYKGFVEGDARMAGVPTPSIGDMSRKLAYRVDEARHVLEAGKPPIEGAGLRIHLERTSDRVIMVIANMLESDVAYHVASAPSIGAGACDSVPALPYNAMVIAKGATERRTECAWRDGMSVIVSKVETMEVNALSAWYLDQTPPSIVGIEGRLARGHRAIESKEKCSEIVSQVVRTGMDRGEIGWRDLVDFYARHRCQTYQFPSTYRAFKSDNERAIPAIN